MTSAGPTHLARRDRFALIFRILGALSGFAGASWAFATSSWDEGWVLALLATVAGGGPVAYHLLTSIARCPSCGYGIINLGIGSVDSKRKEFLCRRCGATAWLAEGFYWESDFGG